MWEAKSKYRRSLCVIPDALQDPSWCGADPGSCKRLLHLSDAQGPASAAHHEECRTAHGMTEGALVRRKLLPHHHGILCPLIISLAPPGFYESGLAVEFAGRKV